jgi:membrane-associated phospholipid phosphatase
MAEPANKNSVEPGGDPSLQVETVSPPVRQYRSTLFQLGLLFALGMFGFLTVLVKITPSFAIDLKITQAIQSVSSPIFAGFMRLISWPGFLPQSIIITAVIALTLYLFRLKWEAVVALVAASFSGATNELIKSFISRPRPGADVVDVFAILDSYSFPSGHVMFYTILFGFIWYLVYTLLRQSVLRRLLLSVSGCLVLLVGISRIYLGQHWASDVLGAYLLGGVILTGVVLLHRWGKSRFFVPQPSTLNGTED